MPYKHTCVPYSDLYGYCWQRLISSGRLRAVAACLCHVDVIHVTDRRTHTVHDSAGGAQPRRCLRRPPPCHPLCDPTCCRCCPASSPLPTPRLPACYTATTPAPTQAEPGAESEGAVLVRVRLPDGCSHTRRFAPAAPVQQVGAVGAAGAAGAGLRPRWRVLQAAGLLQQRRRTPD